VLTVGFFDGVHRGHGAVLETVTREAARRDARSVVVTFDLPPKAVLAGTEVPLITTVEEKAALLHRMGIAEVFLIPFDLKFAELEAEEFVKSVLVNRIGLSTIVMGYDHRFGRGGTGSVDTMRALGAEYGFEVVTVPPVANGGTVFSSTRIREMLTVGMAEEAARHLGRYYTLRGEVVTGDGRGRAIGFPTANLRLLDTEKIVPAVGVYAVFVRVGESMDWRRGVMNVGYRPTVTDASELVAEVHILDTDADLYGRTLEVAIVKRLRDERRFDGLDSLVAQIARDRDNCIRILESVSYPD
jgi:riboflavin kinase/FMN adenylyltransferase